MLSDVNTEESDAIGEQLDNEIESLEEQSKQPLASFVVAITHNTSRIPQSTKKLPSILHPLLARLKSNARPSAHP